MSRTLFAYPCPRLGQRLPLAVLGALVVALVSASPAAAHHAGRPHAPKDVRVVSVGAGTVTLAWDRTVRRYSLSRNNTHVRRTARVVHTFRNLRCGTRYRLGVRAIDRQGRRSSVAARRAHTSSCAPVSTRAPRVSGVVREGDLLVTTNGVWQGARPLTYTQRWLRCDAVGADCEPITGAVGTAYLAVAADVGSTLRSQVEAENRYGSAVAVSAAVGPVVSASEDPPPPADDDPPEPDPPPPSAPVSVQLPAVLGTPQVGNLLGATPGSWSGTAPLSFAYRWRRCDGAGASCADIAGATGSSYRLVSADATRTIRVRVTATNAVGQATATSNRTAAVTDLPPPPTGPGTTLTVTDSRWICDQPLASYGPLPITVEHRISNSVSAGLSNGAVRLEAGCTGDGNPATTDLILHIHGNGDDQGSASDGLVLVGAHDIEIEGFVNCGRPGGGAHQDGIQMNRAYRLTFRGFESGNWDAQTATCHGAGGIFYVSQLTDDATQLVDVVCEGCRMVGSTQGATRAGAALSIYGSTRSGARDSCFSANIPLAGPRYDSIAPIETGNLYIRRNATGQPSPSACTAS